MVNLTLICPKRWKNASLHKLIMIAITIEDISLSFGVKSILENITFSLDETDRLGIIGVNGCGKSTLFKIICGELTADGGAVHVSKDKTVGILRQDDAFRDFSDDEKKGSALEAMLHAFPELLTMEKRLAELEARLHDNESDVNSAHAYTALNEKFIAQGGLEFRGRCASTLQKLGFDKEMQDRCVNDFSGGQRTRLALARELCREPDILMLDEPTNHLDTETLTWLENYLSSYKKCLMVISHDRYFLDRVTNKTLCIENRRAKLYNGGYTKSMEQRKTDLEIEWRHYKNQQKEIARQEAYIAQQRAWIQDFALPVPCPSRFCFSESLMRYDFFSDLAQEKLPLPRISISIASSIYSCSQLEMATVPSIYTSLDSTSLPVEVVTLITGSSLASYSKIAV